MKLKIEIDMQDMFDSIAEDSFNEGAEEGYDGNPQRYNLKQEVMGEIISQVKSSISKDCIDSAKSQAKEAIEKAIGESVAAAQDVISERALEFANEWLNKKTVISDKWGDPVNSLTITDLIKQQFDNLLEKKVDSDGRFNSGYGSNGTLLQFLTGQKVKEEVEKRMKDFGRNIDDQIKARINSGIKESVSNKFAEMVIQTAKSNQQLIGDKTGQ